MKKLRIYCLLITLNLLSKISFGQLVYVELGGAASVYSVNLDNRFSDKTKLGYRIGLSLFPSEKGTYLVVPLQINYVSSGDHAIEIGVGISGYNTLAQIFNGRQFSGLDNKGSTPTVTIAYRYKNNESLSFRVGFTSTQFGLEFPWNVFWPTLSIGRQF